MARNIFIVDAYQVDGQGTYSHISGFPKPFDSDSYEGSVDTALKRAQGSFASTWSGFCAVDNKQVQLVMLTDIFGNQMDRKCLGGFPVEPEPEPEPVQAE